MRALRLTFKTGRPQCGGLFGESTGYSQLDLGQAVDGLNTILGEHRILAQIAECDECNEQLSGSKAAYRHGISVEDWSAVKGQKPGTELKSVITTWTVLQKMNLITSDCGATRSLCINWP